DHLQVHHVHLVARDEQADGSEFALVSADLDPVLVDKEADLLATELLPACLCRRRRHAETGQRSNYRRRNSDAHVASSIDTSSSLRGTPASVPRTSVGGGNARQAPPPS